VLLKCFGKAGKKVKDISQDLEALEGKNGDFLETITAIQDDMLGIDPSDPSIKHIVSAGRIDP
jgi:hypothetical protein